MGDDVVTDTEVGSASNYPTQSDEKRYAPEENRGKDEGFLAKLQRFTGKYGVEQRGIEPVLAHERTDTTVLRVGTLVCTIPFSLGRSLNRPSRS